MALYDDVNIYFNWYSKRATLLGALNMVGNGSDLLNGLTRGVGVNCYNEDHLVARHEERFR